MEGYQLIKISETNATNTYLMYIILAISGYIIIKNYSNVYFKMTPNIQRFTLDITYFLSNAQNTEKFLQNYIRKITSKVVKDKAAPVNSKLDNRASLMKDLNNSVIKLDTKLNAQSAKKIIDYQQSYLMMNNSVTSLSNTLEQINNIQQKNIEAVDKIYATYSTAMKEYLKKLLNVLNIINYQINIAYIKPSMQKMITPLKNLYKSIYDSLVNNSTFLKKFIPEYDPLTVPKIGIKLDAPQDMSVKFSASSSIMKSAGY
jgi:uncharacterized protein YukE